MRTARGRKPRFLTSFRSGNRHRLRGKELGRPEEAAAAERGSHSPGGTGGCFREGEQVGLCKCFGAPSQAPGFRLGADVL